MTTIAARSTRSVVSAPADFTEMYDQYYDYVVGFCIKQGIYPQNADDAAQEIFLRLFATDIIGQFDGDLEFDHRGQKYQARFKSFLNAKVELYVRGKRERQGVIAAREPLLCDLPVGDNGNTSWLEVFGDQGLEDYDGATANEMIDRVRDALLFRPVKGKRDLRKLFDRMCVTLSDGLIEPNKKALAAEMEVSENVLTAMTRQLREVVAEVLMLDRSYPDAC